MHAFFDGYINCRSTLKQFVDQYEIAIRAKSEKEFIADFYTKYKVTKCISDFPWEKQFQMAFTDSIFKIVQAEIKRLWYCHVVPAPTEYLDQQDAIEGVEYNYIMEISIVNDWYLKEFVYMVSYRQNGQYFDCNCKKIESKGVICCHIMKVLSEKNIGVINERYLSRRWRKDVHRSYMKMLFSAGYPQMNEEYKKYKELEKLFGNITDLAFDDNKKLEYVKQRIEEMKNELLNWNEEMIPCRNQTHRQNSQQNEVISEPLRDPLVACSRGRPRGNRIRSRREHGRGRGRGRGGRTSNTYNSVEQNTSNLNEIRSSFQLNMSQHGSST